MKPRALCTFTAIPNLPPELERLRELAYNVRWAWHENTRELFRRLGDELWYATGNNPVKLLGMIPQQRLQEATRDEAFLAHLSDVCADFDAYMKGSATRFSSGHGQDKSPLIAYFSAEFGVTECLPIFAGGLGVLAGDHLKSSSDMGVPLVGIGLMYQQGYFRQHLDESGWQWESYAVNDPAVLPLRLAHDDGGNPVKVSITIAGRLVYARVWHLQVGRVPLYLLDTNFAANPNPEDRDLTDYLYGGGDDLRIRQEMLLGIGGARVLRTLGIHPDVCHINEGHSAFLTLERIRVYMQEAGLSFTQAQVITTAGTVFTTHTPVEAGHDRFSSQLMDRYLTGYVEDTLGLSRREFFSLGRDNPDHDGQPFGMTKLALGMSSAINGVAKLHGEVSRKMWQHQWPAIPEEEVPIGHITNGVHLSSWYAEPLKRLFVRYLGPRYMERVSDPRIWERIHQIPDDALWRTHVDRRGRLITIARQILRRQLKRNGAPQSQLAEAARTLDTRALTIGFARRFATYKRATLLLKDLDRLSAILNDPDRPVQVIFAGKAHPMDEPGKKLIKEIYALSRRAPFKGKIVFLQDYDMNVARYLVQGCDLWLNTPRRPREASGTSGMKAAANGVLNCSILDGWWDEGYAPELGWAIGGRESYNDHAYQDQLEASMLYDTLEHEIVPLFYTRNTDNIPEGWLKRMKESIAICSAGFNSDRMVQEYVDKVYFPAARRFERLSENEMQKTYALADWWERVRNAWSQLRVVLPGAGPMGEHMVGDKFTVRARVHLGELLPEDVSVQLCLGEANAAGEIDNPVMESMQVDHSDGRGEFVYETQVTCGSSGFQGYTVRVHPLHSDLARSLRYRLATWAES